MSARLADARDVTTMDGFNSSASMTDVTAPHATSRVPFTRADIGTWARAAHYDVVFANASMHWVPDHAAVLARWNRALRRGGQPTVQVPVNAGHPAPVLVSTMAEQWLESPALDPVAANLLTPERYAVILNDLSFVVQHVRLQVYAYPLTSTIEVVE